MNKYFKILLGITLAVIVITVVLWQLPTVRYVVFGSSMDVQEVNFYGRVIDQNNQPVAGAIIEYQLGGSALGGYKGDGQMQTDSNGEFSIVGKEGSSLLLRAIKHPDIEFVFPIPKNATTYNSPDAGQLNVYGFQPRVGANEVLWTDTSVENPYVFKAWRVAMEDGQFAQNLKVGEYAKKIEYDKTYTLDFFQSPLEQTKEGEQSGQLRVIFHREADAEDVTQRWEARLIPVDGGIQVTKDSYMNMAPESGYLPEIQIVREKIDNKKIDGLSNQQYYFKSNNGQIYGSLFVAFDAKAYGKMMLDINFKLNPDGERILVQAKSKQ